MSILRNINVVKQSGFQESYYCMLLLLRSVQKKQQHATTLLMMFGFPSEHINIGVPVKMLLSVILAKTFLMFDNELTEM